MSRKNCDQNSNNDIKDHKHSAYHYVPDKRTKTIVAFWRGHQTFTRLRFFADQLHLTLRFRYITFCQ